MIVSFGAAERSLSMVPGGVFVPEQKHAQILQVSLGSSASSPQLQQRRDFRALAKKTLVAKQLTVRSSKIQGCFPG